MGPFKLRKLYVCLVIVVLETAESAVFIRFDQVPPARTTLSTAYFRYSITDLDGRNPCRNHGCSLYCELDNQPLKSCSPHSILLKNLTQNCHHYFLLNVRTSVGERNSSAYRWYIDTEPPTASIISEKNFTNAANVTIFITFSEACTGHGGFKCVNASSCNVMVIGPATLNASTLRTVQPHIKYSLVVDLSMSSMYGRVVVKMADAFCTDQAGNLFTRNNSSIVVHFDRRPVHVDLWTSVPSYELEISRVPRTVIATNKTEDLKIFLEFSDHVMNSTADILNVLHASSGYCLPLPSGIHGNRRFGFELKNVSGIEIITVKLQSTSLIGRSGTIVSPVVPIVFLYDSTKPGVKLSTNSPGVTKETNINVVVEFTKPVFGFDVSGIEVEGGRLARFKELSKALYSLTILDVSQNMVSVIVPEGKANDITGNLNLASNQLEVRHYSTPSVSVVLHSFVTAGLLATSLAAAVLALSSANLAAVGGLTSGATNVAVSDPSRNLLGTVGHLQVFVFSDWLSVRLPIEYSETTKGLRWLIPREKLPWKKEDVSMWPHYPSAYEVPRKISKEYRGLSGAFSLAAVGMKHSVGSNSSCIASLLKQQMLSPTHATTLLIFPKHYGSQGWTTEVLTSSSKDPCRSDIGGLHSQQNGRMEIPPYGLQLDSSEYFIYFLRGEPLSAAKVIKSMENYTGWEDFEMNMFWLGVAAGGLLTMHFLILVFLRWRTGTTVHGVLSVPRFELFLLILMIPCMCQSSAFVIRGGTTGGIIAGSLLLAVPASLLISVCLFLIVAIFTGSLVQYKEVKKTNSNNPWHTKLLFYFTGKPAIGKWSYRDGLPSSFLPRFGILFEDRKGPPVYVLVNRNDPTSIPELIGSSQSGIGRMRAVSSEDSNEDTKIHNSNRIFGCARSAYLIVDLLRRAGLGVISGAYSSNDDSHGQIKCILALCITLVQFLYLFFLKPYIGRGVQVVESISLLCEMGIFSLSFYIEHWSRFKDQRCIGIVMLTLLFISFACQLVNEWYALIKGLQRLPRPQNPSVKLGLKWVAKGLILPFLPRKQWSRLVPGSAQPETGLVPVVLISPETELERQDNEGPRVDSLSAMTATVVPVYSPNMSRLPGQPLASTSAQTEIEIKIGSSSQSLQTMNQRSQIMTTEGKQLKGLKSDSMNEVRMLRELAKASFFAGRKIEEGSTSYAPKDQYHLDQSSSDDSEAYSPRNRQ